MKNIKKLMNVDRIVFGAMCILAIIYKQHDWAAYGMVLSIGYFLSSVLHTPEYFK